MAPRIGRRKAILFATAVPLALAGGAYAYHRREDIARNAEWMRQQVEAGVELYDMVVDTSRQVEAATGKRVHISDLKLGPFTF